jgi:Uncharacterized protein predicted to be involved in DNA repair (RAMP superfamily)
MDTYRITLKLGSSYITPWHADTVFGEFCWMYKLTYGEKELVDFLNLYTSDTAPFIISNGYPGDFMPRPLIKINEIDMERFSRSDVLKLMQTAKRNKTVDYFSMDEFLQVIRGEKNIEISVKEQYKNETAAMESFHNRISRVSENVGDDGDFYSFTENFVMNSRDALYDSINIYFKIDSSLISVQKIAGIFERMGLVGHGRKSSIGKGAFSISDISEFKKFEGVSGANGFIALSNFVPAGNDPVDGQYKTMVKYGKVSGEYALNINNPFKKPLIMITAGSFFFSKKIRPFYGRMVKNISDEKKEIVQYGYAFAVPAKI